VFNVVVFTAAVSALCGAIVSLSPGVLVLLFREPAAVHYAPWIAVVVFLWVVGSFLEVVIVANQEIRLASVVILVVQVSRAALFVSAAAVAGTIHALLIAAAVQGVAQVVALAFYLNSRFAGFWRSIDVKFLRDQLAYSFSFSVAGLLYSLQTDLHNYFVSHRFGSAAYAVYAIGCFQLPLFGILAESVGSVMIPRVSALERERRTREIVLLTARAMRKLALVYFPIYVLLLVVRREFIVTLFTSRYLASVPVFAINLTLIPLGIFLTDPIMRAYAEHRNFLIKLHSVLLLGLLVALPLAVSRFGLVGSISVVVLFAAIGRAIGAAKIIDILGVHTADLVLLTDVAKVAAAAALAGVAAALVRLVVPGAPPLAIMGICTLCFGLVYVSATLAMGVFSQDERALVLNQLRRAAGRFSPAVVETVPVQE
jgi:O-antigen/teichoic acid export membrane protein